MAKLIIDGFGKLTTEHMKEILVLVEEVGDYVNTEYKDNRNVTLKWYGENTVYYYQITEGGNIILKDVIAR